MLNTIRLFVRQPYSQQNNHTDISSIIHLLKKYNHYPLDILPDSNISNKISYKNDFTRNTQIKFTPNNFRNYQIQNINNSNAMLVIRNNISESTAFELGYINAKFNNFPIFFATNKDIESTHILDLYPNAIYQKFKDPEEIKDPLYKWLNQVAHLYNVPPLN